MTTIEVKPILKRGVHINEENTNPICLDSLQQDEQTKQFSQVTHLIEKKVSEEQKADSTGPGPSNIWTEWRLKKAKKINDIMQKL